MKDLGILIGGTMLIASVSGAVAQHAAQGQPPPSEAPQRTTATYGDWVVQCVTEAQQAHQKICDMVQSTQVQGRNLPFSRVAIAHPVKGQPVRLEGLRDSGLRKSRRYTTADAGCSCKT